MAKVILQDVIGSYVYVTKPRENNDGSEAKYSMQIIVPKDSPAVAKIQEAVKKVAVEKFGERVKLGSLKLPLRDGDAEREGKEYENCYFFNASSSRKPGIVNRHNEIADPDDIEEYCYSGATFHVSVNFFAYDFNGTKGVGAGLNNIMLRKKTPRLDGTASAEDEFAQFKSEDDEDEMFN